MGNSQSSKKSGRGGGEGRRGAGEPEGKKPRSNLRESLRSLTGKKRLEFPLEEVKQGPRIQLDLPVENYSFPFENVVFEGGGNRCLAYCGAVRVSRA